MILFEGFGMGEGDFTGDDFIGVDFMGGHVRTSVKWYISRKYHDII